MNAIDIEGEGGGPVGWSVELNSIDPSRAIGGILPPLPADMDYPVVKDALKLGVGEVSEVEETVISDQILYRIVKLVEILEPVRGSYEELANKVRAPGPCRPSKFRLLVLTAS